MAVMVFWAVSNISCNIVAWKASETLFIFGVVDRGALYHLFERNVKMEPVVQYRLPSGC